MKKQLNHKKRWVYCLIILVIETTINVTMVHREEMNNRPIIAVMAQLAPPDYKQSYIAASYVKYLESSGARVVPIPSSMSDEEVEMLANHVNGAFFPGGGIKWFTPGYYHHAKIFYDKAIEAKKQGIHFPVWGTCLGFETLHVLTAGTNKVIGNFSAQDVRLPLNYTDSAMESRLFANMSKELYKALATEDIPYHHHRKGIAPKTYLDFKELDDFFNILSTNTATSGETFVSTIEGRRFTYNFLFTGGFRPPVQNDDAEYSSKD